MATLSVHEAMGFKVDREAVATLVLPQLWSMSIGPSTWPLVFVVKSHVLMVSTVLSLNQFQRFMSVIHKLGDRVEKEHAQFLRDSQRLEDRSALSTDGGMNVASFSGTVDFESLVGKSSSGEGMTQQNGSSGGALSSWEDDVWGSILGEVSVPTHIRFLFIHV